MFRPDLIVGQKHGKGNGDRQGVVPFPANVARFTTLQDFVAFLEARGLKPQPLNNDQWRALCPAHDDQHPSLTFTERDGRILVNCFAGCTVDAICGALGITLRDLRTDHDLERRITFEVRDPNGTLVALHERIERDGKKTFVWRHPDGRKAQGDLKVADLPLYGVHKLQSADFVVIVEGEKCAEALWSVGIPAVATYGATCDPADEPLKQVIERAQTVYLWADNDDAGRKHMERLGKRLLALGATDVRWVEWNDAPEKGDAADAVAQRIDIRALLDAAKPFEPPEEAPQNGATPPTSSQPTQCPFCQLSDEELFDLARPVLDAENPLQAAVERVSQTFGVVGENDNLQLLLLALTTRIFPQPVNVLVVGGTGQGKSFLTDAACATLPPCCHRRIVGASARALLFHPLAKGTVLQWLELPELGGDTIAATILRSILWQAPQETATDYLFVEWTPRGARRRSVQMPRQVALITTKVDLPKDDQLLSRFLVMEVRESPDKRRAVLSALAASFNGVPSSPTDDALEAVRAFAEWLGRVQARVTIPYAHALADLFAELPASERDYRDFATLLKLIAACALWNLSKRQHAFDGDRLQVTADLADYATVYRLLLPVWGKPRSAALSETERRVAEALKGSDHPATAEELAKVIGITDRSVRRALKDLADKGLVERGEKRGRAYEWRLVGDLDALTVTLPTPEVVAAAWQPDPDPSNPSVTDIADIHGHDAMSAKNPINTSTFGFTDKRTSETIYTAHSTTLHDYDKASENFSPVADADSLKNRVRDVREAKNPSSTSTFCGHSPMSANVRDVRDDRHDRDLPNPEGDLEIKVTCPRCGAWRRVLSDALMLADPRCLVCGEVMRPEPEGDPPTEPADPPPADPALLTVTDLETGEPLVVGTDAWLEATFGTACPDCGTTLTDGTCPTCGYPDDRPQWRIGRLVMAIAKALRSRHPQCRSAPCDACRQVVARMNRAVVANDWQGLIALWREVTTDGDAEVSS